MYAFHIFLITIFLSLRMSLNLTCNVPKSLLFKINSVENPDCREFKICVIAGNGSCVVVIHNFSFSCKVMIGFA